MNDIIISAKSLGVGYGTPLISDISFNLGAGEILALIGPNGSGKSTILKTLSHELKKIDGTIFLENISTENITARERAKKMSLLLTERVRPSRMTCREVVESGRYPYTGYFGTLAPEDRAAAEEAIDITGMSDFADKLFTNVSDGQRQRAMLARAICQEPRVMILDEPASYLDIYHKITFLDTLRRLANEKNTAVILSMHEIDFVREIADYVICVKDGAVSRMGRTDEVLTGSTIRELFNISEEMYKRYFK